MHVVLIILDTLRWDYSHYFDWLLYYGFVKYIAWATAPWTLPSHISMFTGLYPSEHGVHEPDKHLGIGVERLLAPKAREAMKALGYGLIGELRNRGYRTVAYTANAQITPNFGFQWDEWTLPTLSSLLDNEEDRAFVEQVLKEGKGPLEAAFQLLRRGELGKLARIGWRYLRYKGFTLAVWDKGVQITLRELKRLRWDKPTFLFLNLTEVHEPYAAPPEEEEAAIAASLLGKAPPNAVERWRRLYSRYARYLSRRLRQIVRLLPRDALVVITSDHGQKLGEGGLLGHNAGVVDEVMVKAPLWVRWPGRPPKLKEPVSLADVPAIVKSALDGGEIRQRRPRAEAWGPLLFPNYLKYLKPEDVESLYGYRFSEP